MGQPSEQLNKPGYIPLVAYVADISRMQRDGPWRLPLGIMDRVQIWALAGIIRFSWISGALCVLWTERWSPAYSVLISYLRRQGYLDTLTEKEVRGGTGFSYLATKRVVDGNRVWKVSGQGFDRDATVALSKAIGELLERMIASRMDMTKKRITASPDAMIQADRLILYPPRYHRFLEVQQERYARLRYASTDPIEWVSGRRLSSQESVWVPSHMTSWFFGLRYFETKLFVQPTSNGSAGYFTRTGAILRGLLETVHRDGLLVHWLTMIPPRRIAPETLPDDMRSMVRDLESIGLSITLLDTTSLSIPSVCVAAISEQAEVPQVVLSGSAAVTFEQALSHALEEMLLLASAFALHADQPEVGQQEPFVSKLNKETRQHYWRGAERIDQFHWFISGDLVAYDAVCQGDIRCHGGDAHALRACIDRLESMGDGYGPIAYHPENPLQKKLGFYVEQVFIPKAFPLYLLEYYGTFESDRLEEFARSKGVDTWKLNPLPHMFS